MENPGAIVLPGTRIRQQRTMQPHLRYIFLARSGHRLSNYSSHPGRMGRCRCHACAGFVITPGHKRQDPVGSPCVHATLIVAYCPEAQVVYTRWGIGWREKNRPEPVCSGFYWAESCSLSRDDLTDACWIPVKTRRYGDVESTSLTLIQHRHNVVFPVGWPIIWVPILKKSLD